MKQVDSLIYEKFENGIAKIWLNRPEMGNRFNRELFNAMDEALREAEADPEVRVIIIEGKGDDFCLGFDVAEPETSPAINGEGATSWADRRANTKEEMDVFVRILDMKTPVIGAMQGQVLGGGWMLAMCLDCLIAAENTVFDNSEMALGCSYTMYTPFDAWKLPMNIAMEKAMTGYPTTAEEGLRYGLFNRVVPVENLDLAATAVAERMLKLAPYVLTMQKETYKNCYHLMGLKNIIPFATEIFSISMHLADSPQGKYWNDLAMQGPDVLYSNFMAEIQKLNDENEELRKRIYNLENK